MSIIKNYLQVLGTKLTVKDAASDEIAIINKEITRIGKMLKSLGSFETGEEQQKIIKDSVDINSLITDLVKLSNEFLSKKAGIEIHLDLDPSLPDSISEGNGLKQIFLNLLKNAAEAMPDGGNVFIKTLYIPNSIVEISRIKKDIPNGKVEITFSDDGPGIPDETKGRLFDPFVTSSNGHEGLGLSIVKELIDKFNGSIVCESEKGKGTSFRIEIPLLAG